MAALPPVPQGNYPGIPANAITFLFSKELSDIDVLHCLTLMNGRGQQGTAAYIDGLPNAVRAKIHGSQGHSIDLRTPNFEARVTLKAENHGIILMEAGWHVFVEDNAFAAGRKINCWAVVENDVDQGLSLIIEPQDDDDDGNDDDDDDDDEKKNDDDDDDYDYDEGDAAAAATVPTGFASAPAPAAASASTSEAKCSIDKAGAGGVGFKPKMAKFYP